MICGQVNLSKPRKKKEQVMDTRREQIDAFLKKCDEVMQSKFIIADTKIGELLQCIVSSDLLYAFFREVTKNFDYDAAREKYMNYTPAGGTHMQLLFPEDPAERLAFVFCLLADFDSGAIDLGQFLRTYFYDDGSVYGSFYAFSNHVVMPFRNAERTVFAEGAAQSAPGPPLEEERSLVYRSSMPDGQKVDALLLLNGLERAKRDDELYCALLAGYLWFAKCTGWKSEHLAALADDLARRKEDL